MSALTLDMLKSYLRYEQDDDSQDDGLNLILAGGQSWIERYTGRLLTQREVTETPRGFGSFLDLRWQPFLDDSLTIAYRDESGDDQALEGFQFSDVDGRLRLYPALNGSWPTVGSPAGIRLTYTAGYADPDDIPPVLLHALAVYAAMNDEDRAGGASASWGAIKALLEDFHLPVMA